jgi:hypothetical protein
MGVGSHLDHTHTFGRKKQSQPNFAYPFKQIAPSTKFTFYSLWDCTTIPYWLALDICSIYWQKDKSIQHIWNARWIVNILALLLRHDYNSYLTTTPTTWMVFFFALSKPQMASPRNLDWMTNWHSGNLNIVGCNILHAFGMCCVWHFSQ